MARSRKSHAMSAGREGQKPVVHSPVSQVTMAQCWLPSGMGCGRRPVLNAHALMAAARSSEEERVETCETPCGRLQGSPASDGPCRVPGQGLRTQEKGETPDLDEERLALDSKATRRERSGAPDSARVENQGPLKAGADARRLLDKRSGQGGCHLCGL